MQYCRLLVIIIFLSLTTVVFIYKYFVNVIPNELRIATGRETGGYYHFAKQYQNILKKDNLSLKIVKTAGSLEALELLDKGKVDLAFVQGGTASKYSNKGLISLASLFYEPLWVFYNGDNTIDFLSDLKGKKISIGEKGSGTKEMFEKLFLQNGISLNNLLHFSNNEAVKKLKNKQIDALCLVISPESPIIEDLLKTKGIKLMSFKRSSAYKDKYDYINGIKFNQGVINLKKNIPPNNIDLLVTTASLVVKKNFNNNLQRLIIKDIKDIHKYGGIFEPKNFFPSVNYVELPISEHTKAYLLKGETWAEKYLPFWFSSLIEAMLVIIVPLIPILIIFVKIVLPSYSLYFKHKIYIWESKIYLLEKQINDNLNQYDSEILLKIDEITKSVKKSCIIYFFYTRNYYDLLLKLKSVEDNLFNKKNIKYKENFEENYS
ncbi:hypothetical protein CRV00_02695 [Malaciobacter molluscorum]|uniref:TAXI family TRAP transporter solute-binding subunit n=1 Tax=Malaciobacter molluscorum TaxID=1032072 RepID=UPI00100BDA33|nr:TAXI family TRAP transporter solute-binding subunit [Malaciobacter molluscorum]RXJ96110.1 hypothetical protein CRV00_02695 [Malaciobacter molluscorum]